MKPAFTISSFTTYPIRNLIRWAVIAEKNGFDCFTLTDWSPTTPNDAFIVLSSIATVTERIKFGVTICNPYSRHPAMIARMLKTLYVLSNGRVILGIGAGGAPALLPLGFKMWEMPIATVRDAILTIRDLLKGETVNIDSYKFRVVNLKFEDEPKPINVPIYIGARRPQMLRLCGKIADGVILGSCPPEIIEWSKRHIQKGLKKAGRDFSEFEIADWMATSISEDSDKARKLIRQRVAMAIYQHPIEALRDTQKDLDLMMEIRRKIDEKKIDEAVEMVTDEMIDSFSLAGTPEEIIEKAKRIMSSGVTHILFGTPLGEDVEKSIHMLGKHVIPALRQEIS